MELNGAKIDKDTINNMFKNFDCNETETNEKIQKSNEADDLIKIKECNRISDIPDRYKYSRFSDFDYNGLEDEVKDFALNSADGAFLIVGPTGVGKTSLLCSALHERAVNDLAAGLYFNDRFLMPMLRTCRSFSAKENEEAFVRRLSKVPFLCIDEIGASSKPMEEAEFLSLIICARYDNKLPTFLVTNLNLVNFSLLLCGIDTTNMNEGTRKERYIHLKKVNATLDRFNSIAITRNLIGDSHRVDREKR